MLIRILFLILILFSASVSANHNIQINHNPLTNKDTLTVNVDNQPVQLLINGTFINSNIVELSSINGWENSALPIAIYVNNTLYKTITI